jgi:hypothetical protein
LIAIAVIFLQLINSVILTLEPSPGVRRNGKENAHNE